MSGKLKYQKHTRTGMAAYIFLRDCARAEPDKAPLPTYAAFSDAMVEHFKTERCRFTVHNGNVVAHEAGDLFRFLFINFGYYTPLLDVTIYRIQKAERALRSLEDECAALGRPVPEEQTVDAVRSAFFGSLGLPVRPASVKE